MRTQSFSKIHKHMYIYLIKYSQPGFDPSFGNLACLATPKCSDRTKQSVSGWQYISSPTPLDLSSLAMKVMVATSVKQGPSNELSYR